MIEYHRGSENESLSFGRSARKINTLFLDQGGTWFDILGRRLHGRERALPSSRPSYV